MCSLPIFRYTLALDFIPLPNIMISFTLIPIFAALINVKAVSLPRGVTVHTD
jgi:hypothetical protein